MEVSDQLHIPLTLPLGKGPLETTGQEAGWAAELAWTQWHTETIPAPARN